MPSNNRNTHQNLSDRSNATLFLDLLKFNMGELDDRSKKYINIATQLKKIDASELSPRELLALAKVYSKIEFFDSANDLFAKLCYSEKFINYPSEYVIGVKLELADIFLKLGDVDKAKHCLFTALARSRNSSDFTLVINQILSRSLKNREFYGQELVPILIDLAKDTKTRDLALGHLIELRESSFAREYIIRILEKGDYNNPPKAEQLRYLEIDARDLYNQLEHNFESAMVAYAYTRKAQYHHIEDCFRYLSYLENEVSILIVSNKSFDLFKSLDTKHKLQFIEKLVDLVKLKNSAKHIYETMLISACSEFNTPEDKLALANLLYKLSFDQDNFLFIASHSFNMSLPDCMSELKTLVAYKLIEGFEQASSDFTNYIDFLLENKQGPKHIADITRGYLKGHPTYREIFSSETQNLRRCHNLISNLLTTAPRFASTEHQGLLAEILVKHPRKELSNLSSSILLFCHQLENNEGHLETKDLQKFIKYHAEFNRSSSFLTSFGDIVTQTFPQLIDGELQDLFFEHTDPRVSFIAVKALAANEQTELAYEHCEDLLHSRNVPCPASLRIEVADLMVDLIN